LPMGEQMSFALSIKPLSSTLEDNFKQLHKESSAKLKKLKELFF